MDFQTLSRINRCMKVYGIKGAGLSSEFDALDVVDQLPTPSVSGQGQVVFLRGSGVRIFVDGEWLPCSLEQPKILEVLGKNWDITERGRQQLLEAGLLALLGQEQLEAPILLSAADGTKYFLTKAEVLELVQAVLSSINQQRS